MSSSLRERPKRLPRSERSLRSEWSKLALRSGSIYATPEWLDSWWRYFGHGRRLVVEQLRDPDGSLVAILPLYLWSTAPLRVLRFIAHGPSDALGAVCAPEDRQLAIAALANVIEREHVDVFVGEELGRGTEWTSVLGARTIRRRPSPVLQIDGEGWDGFLASHGSATRQKIRGGERKVTGAGLSYRLTSTHEELARDLDALFRLHAARFPRGTSDFGWDRRLQAFHREFAALALSRGWLRLWLLEHRGVPVAAHYGFCYGNAHYGYIGGWDPRYAQLTPGRVLLTHAIRQAFDEGVAEFRFLRGGEAYKYWLANDDRPVDTIAVTNGVVSRLALDTYYELWKLRSVYLSRRIARAR